MALMHIRLNLARTEDYPYGSEKHGYEIIAPLDQDGHVMHDEWKKEREHCRVRRFWEGEDDEFGHLVYTRGRNWAFHYDLIEEPADDEVGYHFGTHTFVPGEYVSVREADGKTYTFHVVTVQPLE